jgi:hypothetical protein
LPSFLARMRPMVVLPAPISPTRKIFPELKFELLVFHPCA